MTPALSQGQAEPAELRERLVDLIASHTTAAYACTRVWEAWHVGTMSQDDFKPLGETDFPGELADSILALLAASSAAPTADLRAAPCVRLHIEPTDEWPNVRVEVLDGSQLPEDGTIELFARHAAAQLAAAQPAAPKTCQRPEGCVCEPGRIRDDYCAFWPGSVTNKRAAELAAVAAPPAASEVLVLLIEHDGDDSPAVALARNRSELLEEVKVVVWGERNPANTTNDAGDDMAEGITDTLLEKGVMTFEGDPPLRLFRFPGAAGEQFGSQPA